MASLQTSYRQERGGQPGRTAYAPRPRGPRAARALALAALGLLLGIGGAGVRAEGRTPGAFPRLMSYNLQIRRFTEAELDTLALFDMVSCHEPPEVIAAMRARNPRQRIFYRTMPQNIVSWQEDQTWWHADTLHSLIRLCQFYAQKNDWYLYDVHGERIPEWGGWAANWTRHCPRGVYGTSRGLTYAEWYAQVALPQIAYGSPAWERWGWGSSAYDGIDWEVFNDCPACCIPDLYVEADPDRDGEAEGIAGLCWEDGWLDSLSVLRREVNQTFYPQLRAALAEDLVIRINRPFTKTGPAWAWELNGLKLEDWRPDLRQARADWWDWMYGRRDAQDQLIGSGYLFAEQRMHPFGVDEREGWDVTYIQLLDRDRGWDPAFRGRMLRWGMGTSMLGDGLFAITHDQRSVWWFPEFAWDFGLPLGDFWREVFSPGREAEADTLYVRAFERGFVEVNPDTVEVRGVPAEDARFGFWLPLEDLACIAAGPDSLLLRWRQPPSPTGGDSTVFRYATAQLDARNWEMGRPIEGEVVDEAAGYRTLTLRGLAPGTLYHVAARRLTFGRLAPFLAGAVAATTALVGPDTLAPAAIDDLLAVADYTDGFDLEWTAPGDDGVAGSAAQYLLGVRPGGEIRDEQDWSEADRVTEGLPAPDPAGARQSWALRGLAPDTVYGLALRARDEAGNLAPLGTVLLARTLPGGAGPQAAPASGRIVWRGPFPHPVVTEADLEVELSGALGDTAHLTARIYDATGLLVRAWCEVELAAGSVERLHWDGRNDAGARVAPGLYFLRLEMGSHSEVVRIYVARP